MTYPGGKGAAGVFQRIINQIPPHRVFISAFLGNCAVLQHKRPAELSIGIDLDEKVILTWQSRQIQRLQLYCCDGVAWLKHQFGLYRIPEPSEMSAPAGVAGCWGEVLPHQIFVYCDPPYLMESRRAKRNYYSHEMATAAEHASLLSVLLKLPCRVAISSYRSSLYSERLHGWRYLEFQAMTRGARTATECLWMNYPAPTELQDYRYLGTDKRERERISRRRRNWRHGLERMPELERRAVLAEILRSEVAESIVPGPAEPQNMAAGDE